MTREEIIQGLQFTIDMFLFDPLTGEVLKEPRNEDDKITVDACKGAITALKAAPCEDAVSREAVLDLIGAAGKFSLCALIEDLPPVIPKQRTGKWIITYPFGRNDPIYECPRCKSSNSSVFKNFCPNCGLKMTEGESDNATNGDVIGNAFRWIPVSEKLPESAGVYIVTREFTDGFECADLTDACYFDGTDTWHNDNRINHDREYVSKKIKAWMPLPEPWKGESE